MSKSAAVVVALFVVFWLGVLATGGVSAPKRQTKVCTYSELYGEQCVCLNRKGKRVICEDEA